MQTLMEMLRYMRPHGSKSERKFINRFIMPIKPYVDDCGNCIIDISGPGDNILWSCHIDTVHKQQGKQEIAKVGNIISAVNSSCLGADDAAGVFLMLEMIKHRKPGRYVFHRGEEVGGVGSLHIAQDNRCVLDGINAAIALDRAGTKSVITHQGVRSCSDVFGLSLANGLGIQYELDATGIFTDTYHYIDHVGECTNISVGYYNCHTSMEYLDVDHLFNLREALLSLDTSKLEFCRRPGEVDAECWDYHWNDYYDNICDNQQTSNKTSNYEDLLEIITKCPDLVADFLDTYGVTTDEILRHRS